MHVELTGRLAPVKQESPRIWFAQAMRGIAVALVVWFHLGESYIVNAVVIRQSALLPPVDTLPQPWYLPIVHLIMSANINLGLLGVALFFLTSGFVIPFSLGRGSLRGFVIRRIFRLYPVYWLCLSVIWILLQWRARDLNLEFPYSLVVLLTNGFLVQPYFLHASIDGANWTLSIEELFYACASILAVRGLLGRPLAIGILAGACMVFNVVHLSLIGAFPTLTSITIGLALNSTFLIFILLGVILHERFLGNWTVRQTLVMLFALFSMFLICVHVGPYRIVEAQAIVTCTLTLALFSAAYIFRDRLPHHRLLDGLGNISYPLYMFHGVIGYLVMQAVLDVSGSFDLALTTTFVTVVILAIAIHVLVENPLNNFGRRVSRQWESKRSQNHKPILRVDTSSPSVVG